MSGRAKVTVKKLNFDDLIRLMVGAQESFAKDGVGLKFTIETFAIPKKPRPEKDKA